MLPTPKKQKPLVNCFTKGLALPEDSSGNIRYFQ